MAVIPSIPDPQSRVCSVKRGLKARIFAGLWNVQGGGGTGIPCLSTFGAARWLSALQHLLKITRGMFG